MISFRNFIALAIVFTLCVIAWDVHAAVPCMPKTPNDMRAPGTVSAEGKTPLGEWAAYWCPGGAPDAAGRPTWRLVKHAVLAKYRGSVQSPFSAAWSVLNAADPLAALNALLLANEIIPAPGTQDDYEWRTLLFAACQAAAAPPYLGAPIDPLPVNYCGAPPVPPAPVAALFRTPASGLFTLYTAAGGKLLAKVNGRVAPANALCTCATNKVVSVNGTYCALDAGAAGEVTLCREVK
jgi:hypothetical protein